MSFAFQEPHGWMEGKIFRLKEDTTNPHSPKLKKGTEVKVVMVSRFGDCGITTNLEAENGYSNRVMPWELEEIPGREYRYHVDPPSEFLSTIYGSQVVQQYPIPQLKEGHERLWGPVEGSKK